ncbi:MAG: protein kinase [Pyrinomonadaceae bacterium]
MTDIEDLFNSAIDLDSVSRVKFLDAACPDHQLRRRVETLLKSYSEIENFLKVPIANVSASQIANNVLESEEASAIGKLVGAYRIERELGRGGMGAVYLASRNDDAFEKLVAIKLVRHGIENEHVINRFKNERQILADLVHPNIAGLLDGGITETGLPYLVMEYVDGLPVTEFCSQAELTLKDRIILFRKICSAVAFAHDHSVVHRDIKPSNILVTAFGEPKLLDFGIAKILGNDELASTATAFRMMTPQFASPEQMRGEAVGKASDIYSLGVLFYLLITGTHPYRFDKSSPYEIVRAVCEVEPPAPSGVMRATLHVESRERLIGPPLDNIVLKALRKDPERRYTSVVDFSDDLLRCLKGQRAEAKADSFSYRLAKIVLHYRAGLLSIALLAFVIMTIFFAFGVFPGSTRSNEIKPPPDNQTSKAEFDVEGMLGGSSDAEALRLYKIGQMNWKLRTGESLEKAHAYFQRALALDPDFGLALCGLANTYFLQSVWGNIPATEAFPKARAAAKRALEIAPQLPEGHLSLATVGWLYEYNWPAADQEFKKAIELDPLNARSHQWYGLYLGEMGRFDEAIASVNRALEIEPNSAPTNADLARVLFYAGKYPESAKQYRRTIEMGPNYTAFYSEMLQLYEANHLLRQDPSYMDPIEGFIDPSVRAVYSDHNELERGEEALRTFANSDLYYFHYLRAEHYALLGDPDDAFIELTKAFDAHDHRMAQLKVNPKLNNLRTDPRFDALLKQLKF